MGSRTSRRPRTAVVIVALLAVFGLTAAACGSSRSSSGGGSSTTKAPSATDFGTMASPCGKGDAKGATAQGVTDTQITIGYGDDAGYAAAPGLDKEMSDAMKAMIKWCNDQGGINGRAIVGNYHDAAVLNVNNAMTEACAKDFMLVGQGWVLDSSQEQTRIGCGLPSVPAFAVSPQFSNAPLMYSPAPNPVDYANVSAAANFAQKFPDAVKKTGLMYANFPATQDPAEKAKIAYTPFGWSFLDCDQVYGIAGEANWTPLLQRLKDCGAQVVYMSGSPSPNFENILDAAKQIGFNPMWFEEANNYDSAFSKWNTSGNADNVYVQMTYFPFDQAAQVPAVAKYLEIVKANGGTTALLGAEATAAFLLWAQAAQSCGSNLTRDCMMSTLAQVHSFDAGGLQSPADPGANMPGDCALVLRMKGTTYEQVIPTTVGTQSCDPKYLVKVAGPVVDRGKLDANRISQAGKS